MGGLLQVFRRRGAPDVSRVTVRAGRDVLAAERDGLTVLLDLRRGVYVGLDEVGTVIWKTVADGGTAAAAAAGVVAAFDAPADVVEQDTRSFISDLLQRRLLVVAW